MRTRLVRVRRQVRTPVWALVFLMAAMALYIRSSLPAIQAKRDVPDSGEERGERVSREVKLEELSIYLVSLGRYEARSSARVEAARYVSRGAAGYVLEDEALEVIGAGYETQEAAARVADQLTETEGLTCRVIVRSGPEVTLRMTADQTQIDAFVQAEKALREVSSSLGQLSFAIDRGEAGVSQAVKVIRTQIRRTENAEKVLGEQTAGSSVQVIGQLAELLGGMKEEMNGMLSETGAMALSSRLKYCYVDMRLREIGLMNALAGG